MNNNINRNNVSAVLHGLSACQRTFLDDWAKGSIANNLTCQSALIGYLLDSEFKAFDIDNITNLYEPTLSDDEIEAMGAEELSTWIIREAKWGEFNREVDVNDFLSITVGDSDAEMDPEQKELLAQFLAGNEAVTEDHFAGWFDLYGYVEAMEDFIKEAVNDEDPDPQEIYEWWLVTDSWLAGKLDGLGEPMIDNEFGHWWGRTCTGQAIWLDQTIQKVYLLAFGKPQTKEEEVHTASEQAAA